MGGYFAAVSKEDCVFDLFFGVDYHSHLAHAGREWRCMTRKPVLTKPYII